MVFIPTMSAVIWGMVYYCHTVPTLLITSISAFQCQWDHYILHIVGILPDTCRGFRLGTSKGNTARQLLTGWWGQPTPLKNMSSSIGMMTFPTEWENKSHVPVTTNQLKVPVVCESAWSAPFSLWPFSSLRPGFLQNPRPRALRGSFRKSESTTQHLMQSPTRLFYEESNSTLLLL